MGTSFARSFALLALLCLLLPCHGKGKLSTKFYAKSCPGVATIVRSVMAQALAKEPRMGASIIRLFFHDCFVNGCDASILLDDTATFTGEKNAGANANSVRGYEVIDAIKTQVEAACNGTVSCADIVALASRDAVNLLGGPTWNVQLGRKDSRTASPSAANANLPGLSARDMTALSGAHTVGRARCLFFRGRIYGEPNINATFAAARSRRARRAAATATSRRSTTRRRTLRQRLLHEPGGAARLLHSDQELFNGGPADALVRKYSGNAGMFANDFAKAMVKMGGLMPAAGTPTEVRLNCRKVN
uniref:Peroxidase n=1 Tax=Setaria italica TaxID=4555 RepID=K3Y2J8_SETIT